MGKIKLYDFFGCKRRICDDKYLTIKSEVIEKILRYCDFQDILNLTEVNNSWMHFVKNSKYCVNQMKLLITKDNYMEVINGSFKCNYHHIKYLEFPLRTEVANSVLQRFAFSIKSIETTYTCNFDICLPELQEITVRHENIGVCLEDFDIFTNYNCDQRKWQFLNIITILRSHANQLKIVNLEHTNLEELRFVFGRLNNLQCLGAYSSESGKYQDFPINKNISTFQMSHEINCLYSLPNLRFLKVKTLNLEILEIVFRYLKHLEVVEFINIYYHSYSYCFYDFEKFKKYALKNHQYDIDAQNKRKIKLKTVPYLDDTFWKRYTNL